MKKIIVILITLVVIVAGFIMAYTQEWYPFNPSPEEVLDRSFSKMSDLKTYHFEGQIDWGFKLSERSYGLPVEDMNLIVAGDRDQSNPTKIKTHFDLALIMAMEGMEVSIRGEMINSGDDKIYLKLVSAPALGLVRDLRDQWISLDLEGIEESNEENEEFLNKIEGIFEEKDVVKVKEILESEKINNQMNYHYLASLDKKVLQEAIPDLRNIMAEYSGELPLDKTENKEEREEISSEILDKIEENDLLDFEIWIGKKDNYIHKVEIDLGEKLLGMSEEYFSEVESFNLVINLSLSQFNEAITIEKPVETKTFEEVIGVPFSGSSLNPIKNVSGGISEARAKARDSRIISGISQARTVMAYTYANEGSYLQFNCDYNEMREICQDIDTQYGDQIDDGAQPIIHQSNKAVCIYSPLNEKNNYWYCADSNGQARATEINPETTCNSYSFSCPALE